MKETDWGENDRVIIWVTGHALRQKHGMDCRTQKILTCFYDKNMKSCTFGECISEVQHAR